MTLCTYHAWVCMYMATLYLFGYCIQFHDFIIKVTGTCLSDMTLKSSDVGGWRLLLSSPIQQQEHAPFSIDFN